MPTIPTRVPAGGRSLVRVTAAPLVPLDRPLRVRHVVLRASASPVRPRGAGSRPGRELRLAGGRDQGLVRHVSRDDTWGRKPGRARRRQWTTTWCRSVEPVGDAELAALGLSAVAAWMSLTWRARLQAGERVLVLGGGGAVGQVAIGAARILGADRVVAACRSRGSGGKSAGGRCRRGRSHVRGNDRAGGAAERCVRRAGRRGDRSGVRRNCRCGEPGAGQRRSAGQHRERRQRGGHLLLGLVAQPVDRDPRLHEQRDHRGAAARGDHGDRRHAASGTASPWPTSSDRSRTSPRSGTSRSRPPPRPRSRFVLTP